MLTNFRLVNIPGVGDIEVPDYVTDEDLSHLMRDVDPQYLGPAFEQVNARLRAGATRGLMDMQGGVRGAVTSENSQGYLTNVSHAYRQMAPGGYNQEGIGQFLDRAGPDLMNAYGVLAGVGGLGYGPLAGGGGGAAGVGSTLQEVGTGGATMLPGGSAIPAIGAGAEMAAFPAIPASLGGAGAIGSALQEVGTGGAQRLPGGGEVPNIDPNNIPGLQQIPGEQSNGWIEKVFGKDVEIGDLLSSIPEALAAANSLLGFDDKPLRTTAPIAGGQGSTGGNPFAMLPYPTGGGNFVQNLPRLR